MFENGQYPTTLDDVDYCLKKIRLAKAEIVMLAEAFQQRVKELESKIKYFEGFESHCVEVVKQNLRKGKKSITLSHGTVGITTYQPKKKITEAGKLVLLNHLRVAGPQDPVVKELTPSLKAEYTVRVEGDEALLALQTNPEAVMKTPVKVFYEAEIPIPGVVMDEGKEVFSWE